jgi:thiamine kinase-like enzyme
MVGRVDALEVSNPPTADDLERIAERVPDLRGYPLVAEPLPGGLTNLNYRVHGAPDEYVLRITGEAEMLGADREAEYAATVIAGGLGIGPQVLAYLRPEKILITRFVEGLVVPVEQMRTTAMLGHVAATLRRLHQGPPVQATFSAFDIVETYRDNARWLGVELPEAYEWSWERALEMRAALETDPPPECLCHNDLLNANFLLAGGRLQIVDWEYSGMGDPFFDLANFSANHDLSEDDDRVLLRAYLGRVRERDVARLRLMRIMSDFREAMWGVVQQGLRTTDADYVAYADRFFGLLRERALDERYPGFLADLGG